jgi:hypothetical protein
MLLVLVLAVLLVLPISIGASAIRQQLTSDHQDEPYPGL